MKKKQTKAESRLFDYAILEDVYNSIGDGVFTLDRQCRITSLNPAGEEILGVKQKDAVGQKCSSIFKSDICGDECPIRQAFFTGITIRNYPVETHLPNGKILYLSVTFNTHHMFFWNSIKIKQSSYLLFTNKSDHIIWYLSLLPQTVTIQKTCYSCQAA